MTFLLPKEFVSQESPYKTFSKYRSFTGANVLEIGGNANCVAAIPFVKAGAKRVVVSGLDHVSEQTDASVNYKIEIENANALDLTSKFGASSFDYIYGVSVLEHIPNHNKMWFEIRNTLKCGGMAYLQGAPIWSSALGHHIWLTAWYDSTKKNYLFLPLPDVISQNPIPDWGHLLYDRSGMKKILQSNPDVPSEDLNPILERIYDDNFTNKLSANHIVECINKSGLIIRELEVDRVILPNDAAHKLKFISSDEDFSIFGIRVLVQKL